MRSPEQSLDLARGWNQVPRVISAQRDKSGWFVSYTSWLTSCLCGRERGTGDDSDSSALKVLAFKMRKWRLGKCTAIAELRKVS